MMKSNILGISILKTLQFNLHYFGLRGLKFPVLIFKNFRLNKLCGKVELRDWSFGAVRLGQQMVGIIDDRSEKGIWSVGGGTVCFNGKVKIGSSCRICCNEKGRIIFEDGVNITGRTAVVSDNRITIGKDSLISWDCLLMDTDFHNVIYQGKPVNNSKAIYLRDHVWIGCRSTILGGADIPENSIVEAGSVLTKTFAEENILLGGNNRILKKNILWDK